MQLVVTAIVIVILGSVLAVYWRLGSNTKENITILHNRTIDVQDRVFMENVTLSIKLLKEELTQCHTKIKDMETTITKIVDSQMYIKRDMKVLEGHEEIRNNKTISFDTVLILLFGLAVEGFIFLYIIKYLLSRQIAAHTDAIDYNETPQSRPPELLEQEKKSRPTELLGQVKEVPLNRSICIISFYQETQELHMRLTKSAIQADISIKQFLMKNPETQLMSIPKSRFIFVFVDYNEKQVILETPGQDLGDKKLLTVQAAQKMGADVFVVYVRDRGSTNLPDGVLYNTKLASFTRHPTLEKLTFKDRGLSVYETLTDYQKSHINGIIS